MPIHDWTKIFDGAFHHLHQTWVTEISKALNKGLLPDGYYAAAEQVIGGPNSDVVTLDARQPADDDRTVAVYPSHFCGGVALAEHPPNVKYQFESERRFYAAKSDHIALRHVSSHRLIAVIEIISPGNKNNNRALESLRKKINALLDEGVHLLLVDILPPGPVDPDGLPLALSITDPSEVPKVTQTEPFSLFSIRCSEHGEVLGGFVELLSLGQPLPEMPLFLTPEHYVPVPLESTYVEAWQGVPAPWKKMIESNQSGS
jgi:hypothetical protein